jgi:outer membrane lipoprotein-sorting protein
MTALPTFSRRARWAVPAGAAVIAGAVTAGVLISAAASASPELPARTPAQLLAALAARTGPPPPLTGTVVESASLGIPQLPELSNQNSAVSLLAGSHTVKVWYQDPAHLRLAMPVTMSETDVIRDGRQVWLWQSSKNNVTKLTLPARSAKAAPAPAQVPLTPQQAASQVLKAVGPSTRVSVQRTVTVAGQPAYQLVLSPKSSGSLVGRVNIAIDASNNVPLRVQVFARGASSPAFQVGYTAISFVRPAAANFSFGPPAGAKVHAVTLPSEAAGQHKPSAAQKQAANQVQVVGKDWLSVAVFPASVLSEVTGGSMSGSAGQVAQSAVPGGTAGGGSGETAAVLHSLVAAATPVHGAWGSGQLLHTSLISMLITSNGHVLIGAVRPAVLENAAAHLK